MRFRLSQAAACVLIAIGCFPVQCVDIGSGTWFPDESGCAIDEANRTVSLIPDVSSYPDCIPWDVVCGWKCKKDSNCVEFNIRIDLQLCELYYSRPACFQKVDQCLHYKVKVCIIHSFI